MKTVVTIPTYNERENIVKLINSILKLRITDLEILVIDDNSPDGTWKLVQDISKKNKKVHLLLRKKGRGRGKAGRAGFVQALKIGADYIVEMDADFSHHPKYIPRLLSKIKGCDVVLGSRLVKGAKDARASHIRRLITILANLYIQIVLGVKVRDCNSGYRCFSRKVLEKIKANKIFSAGPSIVQEVLYKSHLAGFDIREIPIVFEEREVGKSKLGLKQLYQGYISVLKLKWMHITGRI